MINLQPSYKNKLVSIRPLKVEDKEKLFRVAADPLIWEQHQCKDRWQIDQFELFFDDSIKSKGCLVVIDNKQDEIIGSSRLKIITDHKPAIEIGWSFLARSYWGGVYNRSVKSILIEHAFRSVDHVLFYIDHNNIRSQKAVKKLGGKLIRKSSYSKYIKREPSTLTFLLKKEEWQNQKL